MKSKRARLSEDALSLIADRFRALSEPMRLRLLIALECGEKNVTELVRATEATQANISRHLQYLTDNGILTRRKEGLHVYYRVADPAIFDLCDHVCSDIQRRLCEQSKALNL